MAEKWFAHRNKAEWKKVPAVQHHLIKQINEEENATWTAGVNARFIDLSLHDASRQLGISPGWMEHYASHPTLPHAHQVLGLKESHFDEANDDPLPDQYDVREKWAETCPIVNDIRDQGSCGSCWAVSSATPMSHRECIWSNGTSNVYYSEQDILSCCGYTCGSCTGGMPDQAWNYWVKQGVVSGGAYGSSKGCWPYQIPPCTHGQTPGVRPQCTGEGGATPYCLRFCTGAVDPKTGKPREWFDDKEFGWSAYQVGVGWNVKAIMKEILTRGSVQATFYVYADFLQYKSGVYQHRKGEMLGGHAVTMIGWGTDESTNTPYWLIANSWNYDWGEGGFFRIRRGNNECKIEELLFAGIPQLPPTPPTPPPEPSSSAAPEPSSSAGPEPAPSSSGGEESSSTGEEPTSSSGGEESSSIAPERDGHGHESHHQSDESQRDYVKKEVSDVVDHVIDTVFDLAEMPER